MSGDTTPSRNTRPEALLVEYGQNCEYLRHVETQQWVMIGVGLAIVGAAVQVDSVASEVVALAAMTSLVAIWVLSERMHFFAKGRIDRNQEIEGELELDSFRRFATQQRPDRWFDRWAGKRRLGSIVVFVWLVVLCVILGWWGMCGGSKAPQTVITTPAMPEKVTFQGAKGNTSVSKN